MNAENKMHQIKSLCQYKDILNLIGINNVDLAASLNHMSFSTHISIVEYDQSSLPSFSQLDGAARYAGLLLAPVVGFCLRPRLFLPFGQKTGFYAVFTFFWPVLVFSSSISNFK